MKKLLSMLLILVLVGAMFTACAQEEAEEEPMATEEEMVEPAKETEKPATEPVAEPEPEMKVDKIKITSGLWSRPEEQQYIREEILPGFTDATGIEVELEVLAGADIEKLLTAQRDSGQWDSDIIMTHSGDMPKYIENDFARPMDDLISGLGITVLGAFNESTKMNGSTYYIPISADVYLLIANNKALPYLPAGADVEAITWEQYKDWALAIAEVEGPKVTFPAQPIKSIQYQLGGISLSYGGGFPEINSDGMKAAWDLVGELMAAGAIVETSFNYGDPIELMKSEEAWLSFYHMVPVGDIYGSAPAKYTVAAAPSGPVGNGTIAGAWGIGITSGTEKVEAAEEFIRFLTNPDILYKIAAGTGGFIPPVEEVIAELGNEPKDLIMKKGLDTLNNGIPSGVPGSLYTDFGAVKSVFDTVYKSMWDNGGTYTDAFLDEQQAALEALHK